MDVCSTAQWILVGHWLNILTFWQHLLKFRYSSLESDCYSLPFYFTDNGNGREKWTVYFTCEFGRCPMHNVSRHSEFRGFGDGCGDRNIWIEVSGRQFAENWPQVIAARQGRCLEDRCRFYSCGVGRTPMPPASAEALAEFLPYRSYVVALAKHQSRSIAVIHSHQRTPLQNTNTRCCSWKLKSEGQCAKLWIRSGVAQGSILRPLALPLRTLTSQRRYCVQILQTLFCWNWCRIFLMRYYN